MYNFLLGGFKKNYTTISSWKTYQKLYTRRQHACGDNLASSLNWRSRRLRVPIHTLAFDTLNRHTRRHRRDIVGLHKVRKCDGDERCCKSALKWWLFKSQTPCKWSAFSPRNGDSPNIKVGLYTDLEDALRVPAMPSHEDVVNALFWELALNIFHLTDLSRSE